MYPYFRAVFRLLKIKNEKIQVGDVSKIPMRVWLSDIDLYPELNNGRHLTLMDIGRYEYGKRLGLIKVLKEERWGLMVAGNFSRYRRRLKLFQKFTLETELIGYEGNWFYFYQKTVRNNKVHSSALIRTAVTSKEGLVHSERVAKALKLPYEPSLPDWVEHWVSLNDIAPSIK